MSVLEDLQAKLIDLFYLDPPVGSVGRQTLAAIQNFRRLNNLPPEATPEQILAIANKQRPAELTYKTELVKNVVDECKEQGFWLSRGVDAPNIIYIEGLNKNGTVNNNKINEWNDVRCLLTIEFNGYAYFTNIWEATVNSGLPYTNKPMNPRGAANIVIPQQVYAWQIGRHITANTNQDALVQVRTVRITRDGDKDGRSDGDPVEDFEIIGLNQHYGSGSQVGAWSAGCLVGSSESNHAIFMEKLRTDRRYKVSPSYIFGSIFLKGYKVAIV